MNLVPDQSTSTKSPLSVKPLCMGLFAAAALSSTLANVGDRLRNRPSLWDFGTTTGTARIGFPQGSYLTSDTSTSSFSQQDAEKLVGEILKDNGFTPITAGRTPDGSMLFQYPGEKKACIDLYPSGEMIVIIRNQEIDEIHELSFEDTERMIQLLRDAPVRV